MLMAEPFGSTGVYHARFSHGSGRVMAFLENVNLEYPVEDFCTSVSACFDPLRLEYR